MSARAVAVIQARLGASRLPGKTLLDIAGKSLLAHVIERARACRSVREVVVATTDAPEDKAVLRAAADCGAEGYAGSRDDVLDRFYQAARLRRAEVVMRVTADDPFKDPRVMDRAAARLEEEPGLDYVSNTVTPTYPEGLDVEVFTFGALERAWREARLPSEREHVTPYIWKNPRLFRIAQIRHDKDLSALRWTVDHEADLRFAREVYARLYKGGVFYMEEVLALLEKEPALARLNAGIARNEGYQASLNREAAS